MKTQYYNPSAIELKLASAIQSSKDQIERSLGENLKIVGIVDKMEKDNPALIFHLKDKDGDPHEVVLRIIQRPDQV